MEIPTVLAELRAGGLEKVADLIERQHRAVVRLRGVLEIIKASAGDSAEGAGEPEFSQFMAIEALANAALNGSNKNREMPGG